jgi:hypothetical protein
MRADTVTGCERIGGISRPWQVSPDRGTPADQDLASPACVPWQITRFGDPEVLDQVELPHPAPGPGQRLYDVSTAGVNYADTHRPLSQEPGRRADRPDRRVTRRFESPSVTRAAFDFYRLEGGTPPCCLRFISD